MASCKATCLLLSSNNQSVLGTLALEQQDKKVKITGTLSNLTPGKHGIVVGTYGNVADPGPIFNPFGKTHGAPTDEQRKVGDLGNITADENGTASVELEDSIISLIGPHSILGRSISIAAAEDDQGRGGHEQSLQTGNAGPRVASGVVGLAA